MFRGARKEELILIADELGEKTTPEMKVLDLKNLILNSEKYKNNKEFMDDQLFRTEYRTKNKRVRTENRRKSKRVRTENRRKSKRV
ncbi:hypothetical protein TNCV_686161 [Trichonephila clavipes]|nr:hypothetical protein TNCV_686161 [Trichonephila clavipes]